MLCRVVKGKHERIKTHKQNKRPEHEETRQHKGVSGRWGEEKRGCRQRKGASARVSSYEFKKTVDRCQG